MNITSRSSISARLRSLVVLCAAALLAGPLGAQTTVQEKIDALAKMPPAERQKFIEAEAIKEGKVVMYSSDAPALINAWSVAFKKRYPQIDAQIVRMSTRDMLQRSTAESRAGKPATDLLHPPAVELAVLQRMNMIAKYLSPEAKALGADYRDPDGWWTVHWIAAEVVGFNTSLIDRKLIPATLEGLANPDLKGKLARTTTGGRWVGGVLKVKGEQAGMEIIKKIADNQPRLYESNSAVMNALGSGQVAVGFDINLSDLIIAKQKGAPLDFVVPDPLFILPVYQVLMKDAPHPYAAVLLYDWILSKEGQAVYPEIGQIGTRTDTAYPGADYIKDAKNITSLSATLLAEPERFNKIFEDLYVRR